MIFELNGKPIAKMRHRVGRGHTYNPQEKTSEGLKAVFAGQMVAKGFKQLRGALKAELHLEIALPHTWSLKKKDEMRGKPVVTKPDNDNYEKFYFDVLSGIGYYDDKQIALNWTQKIYADKGKVSIELTSLEDPMIREHAITYKDKLSADNLNYIIRKANRLGEAGRTIFNVYETEDEKGIHIFFEVQGLKEKGEKATT